jgi:peptidoglycan/xylan/chitin deacetylase (PgdA/CDA1 family)
MYHAVGTLIPDDAQGRYTVTPEQFTAHMEFLAGSGRRVGTLADADVVITFDDGYRDNLSQAYPVLKRLGLPFTIFVSTGFAQSAQSIYLDARGLRRLAEDPLVTIGAHGASHARLSELPDMQLHDELSASKAWLEEVTGKAVNCMSYPHGAVDMRVRAQVQSAGYTHACCSEFGINPPGRDPLGLRRTDIWSSDSREDFRAKLAGEWDWMRFFTRSDL